MKRHVILIEFSIDRNHQSLKVKSSHTNPVRMSFAFQLNTDS